MVEAHVAKVLLVEDLADDRRLIRSLVGPLNVTLFEAQDGEEGVRLARQEHPDVILMDLALPVLDGWEATRRLKADPGTCQIPVIALTAHALIGDETNARRAGVDGFLTKPIDVPAFYKAMEPVLAGHKE